MRTRLLAAVTAALLAVPFLSAVADASPSSDKKCESVVSTEDHCK